MNQNRSQTQTLLVEAEAVLARLAKNRAAMTRPIVSEPALVDIPTRPHPPRSPVTRAEAQRRKGVLSAGEQAAMEAVLAIRGFVANADLQRALGLTMQQASVRLRQLCEAGILQREGPGPNSRYRPAAQWPAAQDSTPNLADEEGTRMRPASEGDVAALVGLATTQSQDAYAMEEGAKAQFHGDLALFFSRQLRSNRRLVLVAEAASNDLVGYITAGFQREPLGPLVGEIGDLLLTSSAEARDVGKRLIECARRWLQDRGAVKIDVSVPATNQISQELFAQLGFQRNTIEMSLQTTESRVPPALSS